MNLMGGHAASGWVKLFQITFLVGLSIGFTVFLAICLISPPPHYKEGENFLVRVSLGDCLDHESLPLTCL
jgi:NCS1 family nucleobase:cation symporter-1